MNAFEKVKEILTKLAHDCGEWDGERNSISAFFVNRDASDALSSLAELEKPGEECEWDYEEDMDVYNSDCGLSWQCIDGTPEENQMVFCPKCGKKIKSPEPPHA